MLFLNVFRTLQHMFEELLRTMLQWDPKIRGGGLDANKRAKWMTHLETILDTKVNHIHIIHARGGGLDGNKRAKWMTHLETILDTKVKHIYIIQGVEVKMGIRGPGG